MALRALLSLRKESEHPAARQEKQGTLALKCFLGPKSSSHLLYKSFDLGNTESGFNDVMPINTFKRSNPIWKKNFYKNTGQRAEPCTSVHQRKNRLHYCRPIRSSSSLANLESPRKKSTSNYATEALRRSPSKRTFRFEKYRESI